MPLDPAKLTARRERLRLSMSEAAARADMNLPNWMRLESGRRLDPQLSTVEKIATALRCSLIRLLR